MFKSPIQSFGISPTMMSNLFSDEDLKVLVDDGHGEEDSGAGANGAHEVGDDREGTDAETSEGGGCRNVAVELVDHGGLAMAAHHHLLIPQLLSNLWD